MQVPAAILEAGPYRKELVHNAQINDPTVVKVEQPKVTLTLGNDSIEGTRERTNYALMELYNQKGYDVFKETCISMKKNNWFDNDDYSTFKGECAEIFLYGTVLEFIKKFDLPWKAYLSLVIPHRNGVAGNTTELDLVLVSEEMITVFEVKSYNGIKNITDICTVKTKSQNKDIYGQNALHCESLIKLIKGFNINSARGMKSVLFSFSEGKVNDQRQDVNKRLMPIIDETTILKYLTSLTKVNTKSWKPELVTKMDELHKALTTEDHMNYINKSKGLDK